MRRWACILWVALLPAAALAATDCQQMAQTYGANAPAEWYACESDSDCTMTRGVCASEAANKTHRTAHDDWAGCTAATVNCPSPDISKHYKAVCVDHRCERKEK